MSASKSNRTPLSCRHIISHFCLFLALLHTREGLALPDRVPQQVRTLSGPRFHHDNLRDSHTIHPKSQVSDIGPGADGDSVPGLQVAVRQSLFNYGVSVGLKILREKVSNIHIPPLPLIVHVPVIGIVHVMVESIQCSGVEFSEKQVSLVIQDDAYHLKGQNMAASFTFKFHWAASILHGGGTGEIQLRDGQLDSVFEVTAKDRLMMRQLSSDIYFDHIDLMIHSSGVFGWLYNTLVHLFHKSIVGAINTQIKSALAHSVPKALNSYLSGVPAQVIIQGLPFFAAFKYSVYTNNFVMVKAFPQFLDTNVANESSVYTFSASGTVSSPPLPPSVHECPAASRPLGIPDSAVLSDKHMVTAYLSESILQCTLWALHSNQRLVYDVKDGDLPNVRLISDLFVMLVPGISVDYPHAPLRIRISATSEPQLLFVAGVGAVLHASYQSEIFVEKPDKHAARPSLRVGSDVAKVATLMSNFTMSADLGWHESHINSIDVTYAVVESKYHIHPHLWEATVRYLIDRMPKWGVAKLFDTFVKPRVLQDIEVLNVRTKWRDGWFQMSGDVNVDVADDVAVSTRGMDQAYLETA